MTESFRIRNLHADDYDDIIRIWTECGLHVKPKGRDSRTHLLSEMEKTPDFLIGACIDNKLIGVVVGSYDGRRGCVNRLAVVREYRKHGVAQELINTCEERLKSAGALVIYALIEVENIPSQKLFKKMKYRHHDGLMFFSKRESDEV